MTVPEESIWPNAIVNPFELFKSLTLSNVGIVANCCKFLNSTCAASSAPAGPVVVTTGGVKGGGANCSAGPVTLEVVNA